MENWKRVTMTFPPYRNISKKRKKTTSNTNLNYCTRFWFCFDIYLRFNKTKSNSVTVTSSRAFNPLPDSVGCLDPSIVLHPQIYKCEKTLSTNIHLGLQVSFPRSTLCFTRTVRSSCILSKFPSYSAFSIQDFNCMGSVVRVINIALCRIPHSSLSLSVISRWSVFFYLFKNFESFG